MATHVVSDIKGELYLEIRCDDTLSIILFAQNCFDYIGYFVILGKF